MPPLCIAVMRHYTLEDGKPRTADYHLDLFCIRRDALGGGLTRKFLGVAFAAYFALAGDQELNTLPSISLIAGSPKAAHIWQRLGFKKEPDPASMYHEMKFSNTRELTGPIGIIEHAWESFKPKIDYEFAPASAPAPVPIMHLTQPGGYHPSDFGHLSAVQGDIDIDNDDEEDLPNDIGYGPGRREVVRRRHAPYHDYYQHRRSTMSSKKKHKRGTNKRSSNTRRSKRRATSSRKRRQARKSRQGHRATARNWTGSP